MVSIKKKNPVSEIRDQIAMVRLPELRPSSCSIQCEIHSSLPLSLVVDCTFASKGKGTLARDWNSFYKTLHTHIELPF